MVLVHHWRRFTNLSLYKKYSNMCANVKPEQCIGKPLNDIIAKLTSFAPLKLAESWDNVGLLVDPISSVNVKNVLLTNDTTEDVVDEAIKLNVGLIVSYHPNIFQGLKSVSSRTWKERIIVKCLQNNIAVFSPHTSWDSVRGGVNDWLADAFDFERSIPIIANAEDSTYGAGRLLNLKNSLKLKGVIDKLKDHIGISHLRLALAKGKDQKDIISSVALCAGSGSSVLKGVQAGLYLTGEMLHHDILEATQNNIHVILCNHSDSERGFLKNFQNTLRKDLLSNEVRVFVSEVDRDPLTTV